MYVLYKYFRSSVREELVSYLGHIERVQERPFHRLRAVIAVCSC